MLKSNDVLLLAGQREAINWAVFQNRLFLPCGNPHSKGLRTLLLECFKILKDRHGRYVKKTWVKASYYCQHI